MNFLRSQVMQKAKRIKTRCALDVSGECFVRGNDGGYGGLPSSGVRTPWPASLGQPTFWASARALHSFFLCAHTARDKNVFHFLYFCAL